MEPKWWTITRRVFYYALYPIALLANFLLYILYLAVTPFVSVAKVTGHTLMLPVRIFTKIITTFEVWSQSALFTLPILTCCLGAFDLPCIRSPPRRYNRRRCTSHPKRLRRPLQTRPETYSQSDPGQGSRCCLIPSRKRGEEAKRGGERAEAQDESQIVGITTFDQGSGSRGSTHPNQRSHVESDQSQHQYLRNALWIVQSDDPRAYR
jgi:hypothetical protein